MHKRIIILIFALLSCNALFSQFNRYQPIGPASKTSSIAAGIKAGVGIAIPTDPSPSELIAFQLKNGFAGQLGAVANIHFGRRVESSPGGTGWTGLQAEMLYSLRRIGADNNSLRMHCIEIPLLFQIYPTNTWIIEGGFTLSKILVCAPKLMQINGVVFSTGQLSSRDVMLTLGTAYKVNTAFTVDLRYNLGFSPLAGNFDSNVSTFNLSAVWYFLNL